MKYLPASACTRRRYRSCLDTLRRPWGSLGKEMTMILADTRQHLSRSDAQLALRLLARSSGEEQDVLERRLADEGIDSLLDDPRLAGALRRLPQGAYASLPLFAYVI